MCVHKEQGSVVDLSRMREILVRRSVLRVQKSRVRHQGNSPFIGRTLNYRNPLAAATVGYNYIFSSVFTENCCHAVQINGFAFSAPQNFADRNDVAFVLFLDCQKTRPSPRYSVGSLFAKFHEL